MGEVYRADDLTLGQPVALKLLPPHLASDPDRLLRFRKEVAVARKVSHPNVCRVYDIAEHEGQPVLTMEFIDGEDLASVLRRFGRLPEERAIEVARQLCSALAAVHEQGLLHRDLKPQNVMLDGRGKVRLTDFGLASGADETVDANAGTVAYMAPEQLAGREVSVQSDLFALGLVLYEMSTGKKAFAASSRAELARKYEEAAPSKPSSHAGGLNPAMEQAILHCLEKDTKDRPRSVYEVLAALPGGDPLAAAVAAGKTPSPELVADAGEVGLLRPWVGLALLAAVVVGLYLLAVLEDRFALYRRVPPLQSPEILAHQAREHLKHLGHGDEPGDEAYWFRTEADYLRHVAMTELSPNRWDALALGQPAALTFFYRRSPQPLVPVQPGPEDDQPALVTATNPLPLVAGMAGVILDGQGRLLEYYAVPASGKGEKGPVVPCDWKPLYDAAELDMRQFTPTTPEWAPAVPSDARDARVGVFPDNPDVAIRVECASWQGKPVSFRIVGAWTVPPFQPRQSKGGLYLILFLAFLLSTVLLAIRNLGGGRGDRRARCVWLSFCWGLACRPGCWAGITQPISFWRSSSSRSSSARGCSGQGCLEWLTWPWNRRCGAGGPGV